MPPQALDPRGLGNLHGKGLADAALLSNVTHALEMDKRFGGQPGTE
jgi:hypothetical protein